MSVLNDVFLPNPELGNKALSSDAKDHVYSALKKLKNSSVTTYDALISNLSDAGLFSTLSSKEINELLSSAIGEMSESYLDVFQQAVEKMPSFIKIFLTLCQRCHNSFPQMVIKLFFMAKNSKEVLKS
ncbi:MAG: hypothetical protein ACMZI0_03670 [Symbiopectobacterium sp.]|uniref:hypothetical protein n=1 Tax=Symbiopectobacterium sp. TaxID=2952789 RepID=UPI0039E890FB